MRYIEVNARGGLVRNEASAASLAPVAGRALHTTIDLDLQRYIDSIWPAGVRGAMVAMTPQGEIRALYSAPSYDPEPLRQRHLEHRLPESRHRRGQPADQPRHQRTVPAGIALQAGDRGDGTAAGRGGIPDAHAGALQRRLPPGQPRVQVLEEGRPRLARPDRRGGQELRRVFLPAGPAARPGRDHRGWRADGLPRPERRGPAERAGADLPGGPVVLRQALWCPQLERAGHRAQLRNRAGREHADPDQHGEVLRRAGRGREGPCAFRGA